MRLTRLPLALGLVLLLAATARAQLLLTLTPAGLSGASGTTLRIAGTLFNTGTSELFLNGGFLTISSPSLTFDDTPFFANVPESLPGGDSFTGEIFDIVIDPAAVPGSYSGVFSVLGGASGTALQTLATANLQVTVTAPQQAEIPEPGAGALLAGGIVPLLGILRRRRR